MKIKLTKRIEEEIEIETPYYFSNLDDCEVHGVITESGVFMIQISSMGDDRSVELTHSHNVNAYSAYTRPEYKGSRAEFESAVKMAISQLGLIQYRSGFEETSE